MPIDLVGDCGGFYNPPPQTGALLADPPPGVAKTPRARRMGNPLGLFQELKSRGVHLGRAAAESPLKVVQTTKTVNVKRLEDLKFRSIFGVEFVDE
jgi:hypothetical protein